MSNWQKNTLWLSLSLATISWGGNSYLQLKSEPMTTYTVSAGSHFSFPRLIKWVRNPAVIHWSVRFDENCNYKILEADGSLSRDQLDWNKLCGVFFTLFNTRGEAAMIGWRYNPDTNLIELAPYYHIEGGRDMFLPILQIKREEVVDISLHIDYQTKNYRWLLRTNAQEVAHDMPFTHNRRSCGFINFYFGGNQAAPQLLSCQMALHVEKD